MQKVTLTVNETAKWIGVSATTIYSMARENQIPCVRVCGRILFHRDVLEKWLRGARTLREGETT